MADLRLQQRQIIPDIRDAHIGFGQKRMSRDIQSRYASLDPGEYQMFNRGLHPAPGPRGPGAGLGEHRAGGRLLRKRLEARLEVPRNRVCMHEFVASAMEQAKTGVRAWTSPRPCWTRAPTRPRCTSRSSSKEAIMIEQFGYLSFYRERSKNSPMALAKLLTF